MDNMVVNQRGRTPAENPTFSTPNKCRVVLEKAKVLFGVRNAKVESVPFREGCDLDPADVANELLEMKIILRIA